MIKIVVFFSLFCFVAELTYSTFVYIDFIYNQDYYSTTLCVNKDKPEMKCKGQCVLMKKLAMSSKQRSKEKEKQIVEILDLFEGLYFEENDPISNLETRLFLLEKDKVPSSMIKTHQAFISGLLDPPKIYS